MALVPLFHRTLSRPGRLAVTPDDPDAVPTVPRRRNAQGKVSRRPHGDSTVAQVRRLIEQTALTYDAISAQSGVGRATISRWARDMAWRRPFDAPRSTDRMPTHRASQRRKLRTLAERLRQLAERHVTELENAAAIDPDKLMAALQLLKMARLEAMGRRRRRKPAWGKAQTGQQWMDEQAAIRTALSELHRGGVNVDKAPQDAVAMVVEARMPPLGKAFGERGRRK